MQPSIYVCYIFHKTTQIYEFVDQPFQVRGRGEDDEEALYETELVEVASDQEDEVH